VVNNYTTTFGVLSDVPTDVLLREVVRRVMGVSQ
jgi:hypothetical protein